jgi:hypothetical protein
VCSTISTAYVHGGRPGVLPETAVAADEPPSLWHPLEPQSGGGDDGSGPAVAVTANGSQANGHSSSHSNGHANGHSEGHGGSRASVPGVFLDLESELAYAQVRDAGPAQCVAWVLLQRRRGWLYLAISIAVVRS